MNAEGESEVNKMNAYKVTVTENNTKMVTTVIAQNGQSAWNKYIRGRPIEIGSCYNPVNFQVQIELISYWVIQ